MADVWGRVEARSPQGRGAGGDGTVYVDSLAERIVLDHLEDEHRRGRRFTLISEEAGERDYGGGEVVVVDPIDGSHNAKMGIPYFSLTLAASRDRTYDGVYEAAVCNLITGDRYEGLRGGGARLNGARLRLNSSDAAINVLQVEPRPVERLQDYMALMGKAEKVRMLGSAALSICLVASGAVSLSLAASLRSVDCAAALLVLSEAGGEAANLDGAELGGLDLGLDVRSSVVAAANRTVLHDAIKILQRPPVG